ncbi:hypothetical protein N9933_03720 [bacterium]|nr:hypothetical protein [bacterium]
MKLTQEDRKIIYKSIIKDANKHFAMSYHTGGENLPDIKCGVVPYSNFDQSTGPFYEVSVMYIMNMDSEIGEWSITDDDTTPNHPFVLFCETFDLPKLGVYKMIKKIYDLHKNPPVDFPTVEEEPCQASPVISASELRDALIPVAPLRKQRKIKEVKEVILDDEPPFDFSGPKDQDIDF